MSRRREVECAVRAVEVRVERVERVGGVRAEVRRGVREGSERWVWRVGSGDIFSFWLGSLRRGGGGGGMVCVCVDVGLGSSLGGRRSDWTPWKSFRLMFGWSSGAGGIWCLKGFWCLKWLRGVSFSCGGCLELVAPSVGMV